MAERPPDLVYAVDETPPIGRLILLGLQFSVLIMAPMVMLILVMDAAGIDPTTAQGFISLGLLVLAFGAVIQARRGRWIGSGFLAPPIFSAVYIGPAVLAAKAGGMPAVAGMTLFAGLIEIGLGLLLKRLRIVFQPFVGALIVLVVGLDLGLIGLDKMLDIKALDTPGYGLHVLVAFMTVGTAVTLSVWGRGIVRLMCSLIALIVGLGAALATGLVGSSEIDLLASTPWFALPDFSVIGWRFDPALIPAFLLAGAAAAIRVTGVIATAQRISDAAWKHPDTDGLKRGVLADGFGTVFAGLFGVSGVSSAPSIVGLSMVIGAVSRAIAFAAAGFLVIFALLPKVSAFIVAWPPEVYGGLIVFNGILMTMAGVQAVTAHGLNVRTGVTLSLALFFGLLFWVSPQVYQALPAWAQVFTGNMLTISLVVAILLTLLFRLGITRRQSMAWRDHGGEPVQMGQVLGPRAKSWKLESDNVTRAETAVADLVRKIEAGGHLEEPVRIDASFDDVELLVEVVYRGRPVHPSRWGHRSHHTIHEQSALTGLSDTALAAEADRTSVVTRGDEVEIKLWFTT